MSSVHFSGLTWGTIVCTIAFCSASRLFAADFLIWTDPKPAVLFAGENKSVNLFVKNSATSCRKVKLDARLFQVAATATSPLSERKKWKEISLNSGETSVEKYLLKLPKIQTTTSLVLKFYEEGNVVEVSSIPFVVFPSNVLASR